MHISVGTFNLNNLFSRFNFSAAIDDLPERGHAGAMTYRYEFSSSDVKVRTFLGKLVKAKRHEDTLMIAERILEMDLDVLAVQEVEDIHVMTSFNEKYLDGLYSHKVLVEGNDPRFIDVALFSKLPLGAITSFQAAVHRDDPGKRVFGRDLLEVEVLCTDRSRRLFTIYNNHFKSHFGDDRGPEAKAANDTRRSRQAETVAEIVGRRMRSDEKYIITGDMNDGIDAGPLRPMLRIDDQPLFNALEDPEETRPAKHDADGSVPETKAWTHRYKESGQPPDYCLFDQIWLSPGMRQHFRKSWIHRRKRHGGDGSDHDPAWVELDM